MKLVIVKMAQGWVVVGMLQNGDDGIGEAVETFDSEADARAFCNELWDDEVRAAERAAGWDPNP